MPEKETPKFDEGAERLHFPNDREPTDEELKQEKPTAQWFKEKGPWFSACYFVYRSIQVNDSVHLGNISYWLSGIFSQLEGIEGWEYAHRAELWYRQKTRTAPVEGLVNVPPQQPKIGPPIFDKKKK